MNLRNSKLGARGCGFKREEMIEAITVFDHQQKVLAGRFYKFILACRLSFTEQFLSVADYAVSFGEYLSEGFVGKHRGTFPDDFARAGGVLIDTCDLLRV